MNPSPRRQRKHGWFAASGDDTLRSLTSPVAIIGRRNIRAGRCAIAFLTPGTVVKTCWRRLTPKAPAMRKQWRGGYGHRRHLRGEGIA